MFDLYKKLEKNNPITKEVFIFTVFFISLFALLIHFMFPNILEFISRDSIEFHKIAVQLRHFMETGNFDYSIVKEGDLFYEELLNNNSNNSVLLPYLQQFPAVVASIIYYVFKSNEPMLVILSNSFIYSFATTLMYLFFWRTTRNNISSLLGVFIISLFPCNILCSVLLFSKGIYYYFVFSLFCFTLTTQKKLILLFFSFLLLFISRPSYFLMLHSDTSFVFPYDGYPTFTELVYSRLNILADTLIKIRNNVEVSSCTSNFDYSTLPTNGKELIEYIPKGFLIGLLKPYPSEWFNMSKGFSFLVSSIEMVFIYIGLFFLPFSLFRWRESKNLFIVSIVCLLAITVYGSVSYNLGYLYRVRFIFIATLAGIGLMYLPSLFHIRKTYVIYFRKLFQREKFNLVDSANTTNPIYHEPLRG